MLSKIASSLLVTTVAAATMAVAPGTSHAEQCSDYDVLTAHPATHKYLMRDDWQVLRIPDKKEDTVKKLLSIRDAYHKVPLPSFLKAVLYPGVHATEFEGWVAGARPLRVDAAHHKLLFVPNPEYFGGFNPTNPEGGSGFNAAMVQWTFTAKWLKCRDGGAVSIAWYRDPRVVPEDHTAYTRTPAALGAPDYKTNILDITANDLEFLKDLRKDATDYARRAYGYNPEDKDRLSLYFHWPTGEATNTLHLHIRVNYLMSAVEYHRAVMLDDLIAYMEANEKSGGPEFIAAMAHAQGALILPGFGDNELVLGDAFAREFPVTAMTPKSGRTNPFKAIVKTVMRAYTVADVSTIQTVSADHHNPSAIRLATIPRGTLLVDGQDVVGTNPLTKQAGVVVLTANEVRALGLTRFYGKPIADLVACIQPYADNGNKIASRCLKWDNETRTVYLEPIAMPGRK